MVRVMSLPLRRYAGLAGVLAAILLALLGAASVNAAPVATASIADEGKGVRITVAVTGTPLPTKVSVKTGKTTVALSGSGASWRSRVITGKAAKAFKARTGKTLSVILGKKALKATLVASGGAAGGGGASGGGTTGGGTTAGLPGAPTGGLTGQAAIDKFNEYLRGSVMTRVQAAANLSSQSTTRFSFCQGGGTFVYYRESIGNYTASTENAQATYRVTQAAFNAGNTMGEGIIEYQASPGDTQLGPSGQAIMRLGSGIAWINSLDQEYQWQSGVAGC